MKSSIILFILFTFGISFGSFAQDLPVYRAGTGYKAYQQGKDGTLLVSIETKGETVEACKLNAMKQVAFSVIFVGYEAQGEIPAASPLADMGAFEDKKAMFEEYLNGPDMRLHVIEAQVHPSIPVEKLSKKEYRGTFVVTVNFERMRKYLEDKKIIKAAAALGFKPSVAILPDKAWMDANNFVKNIDNQGVSTKVYDYKEAIKHPSIKITLDAFKAKFDNRFTIVPVQEVLEKIDLNQTVANQSNDAMMESVDAKIGNALSADLWIKVNLINDKDGIQNRASITLTGFDPYSMSDVINAKPIVLSSRDNEQKTTEAAFLGAADNIAPRILTYFTERVEDGMKGVTAFAISQNLKGDLTFDTKFSVDGKTMKLSSIIKNELGKREKKNKDGVSRREPGPITDATTLKFTSVYIPLFTEDEETGEKVKNNFDLLGQGIQDKLKKIGLECERVIRGLGDLTIRITGKKDNWTKVEE